MRACWGVFMVASIPGSCIAVALALEKQRAHLMSKNRTCGKLPSLGESSERIPKIWRDGIGWA